MNYRERKKFRTEFYLQFIYGWKQRPCISCNGSGYYDWDNGPCGACDGEGIELYPGPKSAQMKTHLKLMEQGNDRSKRI
jgi:DnaJ-class molecular chaperone